MYTHTYTYQGILRKNYSNFTYLFKDHSYKTNLIFFPSKMPHIMGFWANIKSFRVPTFYNYMYLHVPLDYHSQPYPRIPCLVSPTPTVPCSFISLSPHTATWWRTNNGHLDRVHTCLLQNTQPNSPKLLLLCCILIFWAILSLLFQYV